MGSRRCSTCGISFPPTHAACDFCDERTDYISHEEPDPDWAEKVRWLEERPQVEQRAIFFWRADALELAGYDLEWSEALASNRGVDLHDAVELLADGCPLGLALRILV